jgi:hypothetical protein
MKSQITKLLLAAALALTAASQVRADDAKTDPSGTYIWTQPGRNGGPDRTNTLVLKLEGDALTGKLTSPGRGGQTTSADIMEGKVAGSTVSFATVRSYNGNSMTNRYSGTLSAGTITGKIEGVNRNGDPTSRDWEAKLQK